VRPKRLEEATIVNWGLFVDYPALKTSGKGRQLREKKYVFSKHDGVITVGLF